MLVETVHNIVDSSPATDAVLSHSVLQCLNEFRQFDVAAFYQARDHPDVRQHRRSGDACLVEHDTGHTQFRSCFRLCPLRRVCRGGRRLGSAGQAVRRRCRIGPHRRVGLREVGPREVGWRVVGQCVVGQCVVGRRVVGRREVGWRRVGQCVVGRREVGPCGTISAGNGRTLTASAVELFLLPFPAGSLIVRRAPPGRTSPTMLLTAAERAARNGASDVPGIRQIANPAVAAEPHAALQSRMKRQHRFQRRLTVPHQSTRAVSLMPVAAVRKRLSHGHDKSPRFSVMIRSGCVMPPSYRRRTLVASTQIGTPALFPDESAVAAASDDQLTSPRHPDRRFFFSGSGPVYLSNHGSIPVSGIAYEYVSRFPRRFRVSLTRFSES